MQKKKKKTAASASASAAAASASAAAAAADDDLKPLIHDYSAFFDNLIDLIPARFYLPSADADGGDKPWFQGLSKAARAAAKKQSRENLKIARRLRLDPQSRQNSTLERLNQTLDDSKNDDDDDDVEDGKPGDNPSVTYEELRQRLHRRIELLKGNRGDSSNSSLRKRKRDPTIRSGFEKKSVGENDEDPGEAVGAVERIEFGKVKLGGEEERDRKRKKLSKGKELERAKKLQDARKDPEKGDEVAKKHSWKAAVSRAAGEKVHDDPKLLRQSMHKEKKRQEKNAGKWKERVESREKAKAEKQQKRAGNIADRIQQNKARKIAKREKKLMRPGFEGRKEGYINR